MPIWRCTKQKNLGGNQVYLFEDRLCNLAKQRLEMLQALNHSELDDEFQLYFQAQINAEGQIVSAETLLRWFHPTLGLSPLTNLFPCGRGKTDHKNWSLGDAQSVYTSQNLA